jgi:hypothetical protein
MTQLTHTVKRETATLMRDGGKVLPIVVEVHPDYTLYRQKGRRHGYMLPHRSAYLYAVHLAVEQQRQEKGRGR